MPNVADLLAQSRAAHDAYRMALPRRDTQGQIVPGDSVAAEKALVQAFALRLQAEALDMPGIAPAWADQERTHPHYALLKFYAYIEPKLKSETTAVLVKPPDVGVKAKKQRG